MTVRETEGTLDQNNTRNLGTKQRKASTWLTQISGILFIHNIHSVETLQVNNKLVTFVKVRLSY